MIRADRENWKAREVTRLLALVETERHYYQEIVSGLPSGVAVVGADLRIASVNSRFWEVLGLTSEDVLGRSLASFLPAPELKRKLEEAVATGVAQRDVLFEFPVAGVTRSLRAAVSVLKPSEGTSEEYGKSLLLVIDDVPSIAPVTPPVPAPQPPAAPAPPPEPRTPSTEKVETLTRITGRMAHEFNNLLMVITGYSDEVMDKLRMEDPAREDAQEIINAANRATELTRLLLAYARRQVMDLGPVDLNHLLTDLEDRLRRVVGEGVQFVLDLDPRLALVNTDAAQIEQAVGALVRNAREAINGSGSITIRTAPATDVPGLGAGSYVALSVSDTGRGMDAQTRDHLFEPFFTTKEEGRGTGMALAASYGIVRQSGGTIAVESTPGAGSTFTVYLPTAVAPRVVEPVAGGPAEQPLGTALVVEEENSVRLLESKILHRNGYRVLEAAGAEEALRISTEHSGAIDLLITGMVLPQQSGRALADKLLEARPQMKALYVFGYTDADVALADQLPEGAVFLQKPFSVDALLDKVRKALGV
jgi:PAS domain S-box-containing protein